MALLFREIRKPALWDTEDVPELDDGEFPARAYQDLRAPDNCLSFWRWDEDLTRRQRLVAALVCKSGNLRPFAYVLVEEAHLEQIGCELSASKGGTDDHGLNDVHVDATELSGFDAYRIGKVIRAAICTSLQSLEEDEVLECIQFSSENGFLGKTIPGPIVARLRN